MLKIIGSLSAIVVGFWAVGNFGGMFGLTPSEKQAIEAYKNQTLDRAAPALAPMVTKQGILDAEQKFKSVMPTQEEVQTAFATKIVPVAIHTIHRIGKAAQSEISKTPSEQHAQVYDPSHNQYIHEMIEATPVQVPPIEDSEPEQEPVSNLPVYQQ